MKLKTRRDFVKLRTGPALRALLSRHVQMLRMETCACLINYQECTLRVPLQDLSAENYAIKKPQGMRAVCSPCPTSVPVLQFQRKSQTICAQKGKGMCKKKKKREEKRVEEKPSLLGNAFWTPEHWYSIVVTPP